MEQSSPLRLAVERLNDLLMQETEALRRLDHETLDSLTDTKVALLRELSGVDRSRTDAATLRAISQVRDRALNNQVLMVHARDMTRGVFDTLTGIAPGSQTSSPRLLELRG